MATYVTDEPVIPGFDDLRLNNGNHDSYSDNGSSSFGGPPPAPPAPPPMQQSGGGDVNSNANEGQVAAGPPPPPPPPPPGLGSMPTYKQQKDQDELANPKDLAAKLAGGKKSDAKPFSYGISAADLKTPSEIKRANAARAAGGAESPGRPSTPSFGRRTSGDAPSGSLNIPSNSGGLPDHGARPSSLASALQARRNSFSEPTFGSSPVPPSHSPSPYQTSSPLPPSSTPTYAPPPPRPPVATQPQQYQFGNEFAGQPIQQPSYVQPPARTTSMTGQRPVASPTNNHNGPAYDQLSNWASNQNDDDSGQSTRVYSNSPQPRAPPPPVAIRSRSNSFTDNGQPGATKAAQMLQNIRSNYSGSNSSPVQQVYPREGSGRESPARQLSNSGASSPYQQAHSAPPPQQPVQTYYYGQQPSVSAPQNQTRQQHPAQQSYQAPASQQYYQATPSHQPVVYSQQDDLFGLNNNYNQQQSSKTPSYVHTSYQRSPPPDLSTHRTLPYSNYVTPTDIDFSVDPFSQSFGHPTIKANRGQQQQQQPQYTSHFRTEMQLPMRQAPSGMPDWDSGFGGNFTSNFRPQQQQQQQNNSRVIPIQIQYSPVTATPSSNQQWRNNSGMSDF
ncbi:hypothetical protein BV898_17747 [Hypsibius exemplaris]|uniref:Uncharacterized protein n=1 Tax=Hypsibius exemplaris TaxID=2072580 RepID=A0A9X6NG32_HYPEX|nr:hypothetical protein BV898_17747 [Hypsibius exemplaris]